MTTQLGYEPVRAIASRLSAEIDGVDLVVKAVLDELGTDPERLRFALAELLPDYVGTCIRVGRAERARSAGRSVVGNGKRRAILAWHERFLADQLHVADGYRRMAECTFEDLMFAAAERRTQAAATNATADGYERLANALHDYDAKTVEALPAAVVQAALRGEAA
jgi:hypothetical protein